MQLDSNNGSVCVQRQPYIRSYQRASESRVTTVNSNKVDQNKAHGKVKRFSTRVIYNSRYNPQIVGDLLVRPLQNSGQVNRSSQVVHNRTYAEVLNVGLKKRVHEPIPVQTEVIGHENKQKIVDKASGKVIRTQAQESGPSIVTGNNNEVTDVINQMTVPCVDVQDDSKELRAGLKPLFDINDNSDDKFGHALFHNVNDSKYPVNTECATYRNYCTQSNAAFGFVPCSDQLLPSNNKRCENPGYSIAELHHKVKGVGLPNFLGARIPVKNQLNIAMWKSVLSEYWDQQLLQLLEFGFPVGFDRNSELQHDIGNHKSATEYPADVLAYLEEEKSFGAIEGPFSKFPIDPCHVSPFMTRPKPNSATRRVIIDLSWPKGASVNDGVNKTSYLGSDFKLTFPTIDHLTSELKKLGRGAHIFKVDVSRAFRHLSMDPADYDLLGLYWDAAFVDTKLPFGCRHGSQFFQRTSDAVRYVMRRRNVDVINYIDDFLGYGTPEKASRAFHELQELMRDLGLTISAKKLIPPSTQAVCLGILVDTTKGTVAIPQEKLEQIKQAVRAWTQKRTCTKRQLQSLLGLLLYIHKCVKPARIFLNRMLDVLRQAVNSEAIRLTPEFHRDLAWFDKFLDRYNGVSMYDHRSVDAVLELDACLTGLGGRFESFVYSLQIPRGYRDMNIVHLEMVNIVLAVKLFSKMWAHKKVLVRCDNQAVVSVLQSGRARDPFLGACARNVWYLAALNDIDLQYAHINGRDNRVADLLSRWQGSLHNVHELKSLIHNPIWFPTHLDMLDIDVTL